MQLGRTAMKTVIYFTLCLCSNMVDNEVDHKGLIEVIIKDERPPQNKSRESYMDNEMSKRYEIEKGIEVSLPSILVGDVIQYSANASEKESKRSKASMGGMEGTRSMESKEGTRSKASMESKEGKEGKDSKNSKNSKESKYYSGVKATEHLLDSKGNRIQYHKNNFKSNHGVTNNFELRPIEETESKKKNENESENTVKGGKSDESKKKKKRGNESVVRGVRSDESAVKSGKSDELYKANDKVDEMPLKSAGKASKQAKKEIIRAYSKSNFKPVAAALPTKAHNDQSLNNRSMDYQKCFVLTTNVSTFAELNKVISAIDSINITFVYKKRTTGFSFCTSSKLASNLVDFLIGKYPFIRIEEDKIYRISDNGNDKHQSKIESGIEDKKYDKQNVSRSTSYQPRHAATYESRHGTEYEAKPEATKNEAEPAVNYDSNHAATYDSRPAANSHYSRDSKQDSPKRDVPLHIFRMFNMGNLIFNNYLLDNFIFRLLGINLLIKSFYSYNSNYTGKNVNINIISTPKCNSSRIIIEALLTNPKYSISKDSNALFIEAMSCNGTISLSTLLHVLDNIIISDLLILPLYGPHSDALDDALLKISQTTTIVAPAGDEGEEACNYSPNGKHIIKVGSSNKNGYLSDFSNRGSCINLYAIGEGILTMDGSTYSAAIVGSIISSYKEKYPNATHHQILKFLLKNTLKSRIAVLKVPNLDVFPEFLKSRKFYSKSKILIFYLVFGLGIGFLIWGSIFIYKMTRSMRADEQTFTGSLRSR